MAPNRIDILTDIDGVDFAEAWKRRKEIELDGMKVYVLSAKDIIKNKEASGRPKDKIDVDAMKKVLGK